MSILYCCFESCKSFRRSRGLAPFRTAYERLVVLCLFRTARFGFDHCHTTRHHHASCCRTPKASQQFTSSAYSDTRPLCNLWMCEVLASTRQSPRSSPLCKNHMNAWLRTMYSAWVNSEWCDVVILNTIRWLGFCCHFWYISRILPLTESPSLTLSTHTHSYFYHTSYGSEKVWCCATRLHQCSLSYVYFCAHEWSIRQTTTRWWAFSDTLGAACVSGFSLPDAQL